MGFRAAGNSNDEEGDVYSSSKPTAPACERTLQKHVPRAKPAFSSREEKGTLGKEVEDLNHSRLGGETAIGVHAHKEIKNFQKSSRAICGALGGLQSYSDRGGAAGQCSGRSQGLQALESG